MLNGYVTPHTALCSDAKADVVVIGGGISGALTARELSARGADIVLLDRRHVGMGSTCASTALLQYDIDKALHELIEIRGEAHAVRAYELSLEALQDLEKIAKKFKQDVRFERRPSYRFGRFKKDIEFLEKEYDSRTKHGFAVDFLSKEDLPASFSFATSALCTDQAAIADPYLLTHAVLAEATENGARIFDKSGVKNIERRPRSVVLHLENGPKITAKKVVIACGYETVNYLPKDLCKINSTYALVSQPLDETPWPDDATFWTLDDPYLYGRTTSDKRIVFGGEDVPISDPAKRDAMLDEKTKKLEQKFVKMFPEIPLVTDYAWAGTFVETDDGLPFIGMRKGLDHTYFALGYGGNGITFSQLAAGILSDQILGQKNADAEIFSFDR